MNAFAMLAGLFITGMFFGGLAFADSELHPYGFGVLEFENDSDYSCDLVATQKITSVNSTSLLDPTPATIFVKLEGDHSDEYSYAQLEVRDQQGNLVKNPAIIKEYFRNGERFDGSMVTDYNPMAYVFDSASRSAIENDTTSQEFFEKTGVGTAWWAADHSSNGDYRFRVIVAKADGDGWIGGQRCAIEWNVSFTASSGNMHATGADLNYGTINDVSKSIPPMQQHKMGVNAQSVSCKAGLVLAIKASNGEPACVNFATKQALAQRGWAKTVENALDIIAANPRADTVSVLFDHGGTYGDALTLAVGKNPYSVAVGDFNGDGNQDLLSANMGSDDVSILFGDGNGNFDNGRFGSAMTFDVGEQPRSIVVSDFNKDGNLDFATSNKKSDDISVLFGNGMGGILRSETVRVGDGPESLNVADFDADGNQDIATANAGSNSVSVLFGDGDGAFDEIVNLSVGQVPRNVAVGDFNGDSRLDVAVSNRFTNISILFGGDSRTFGNPTNFDAGKYPYFVATGDFNRDHKPDLVTSNTGSNDVSVLLGNGKGSFEKAVNYSAGTEPVSVTVSDVNGDGNQDLLVAHSYENPSILLGDGTGKFGEPTSHPAGMGPSYVVTTSNLG